jgi:uncharacterized delta-60 repeat protein
LLYLVYCCYLSVCIGEYPMLQLISGWKRILPKLLLGVLALWLAFGANGNGNGLEPLATHAAGQDGAVDPTFQSGSGLNSTVYAIALQPDGKILIGGNFITYNATARNRVARLNADGSLDTSFNPGTGANNILRTIALQPDGKVLIGGFFTSYNGTARNRVARLNPDGSLDTAFNPGTGANDSVNIIALQPDGKVLIGGVFTTYNGVGRNRIARLNADGSLDTSFLNTGTGANGVLSVIALQPDGKVLIGGFFSSYNGTSRNRIARLNADGSLDTSFDPGTGATGSVDAIALQADGKIFIGGFFTSYNGVGRDSIARLNADGSVDTTFLNTATAADNGTIDSIALQADGKILIAGFFTSNIIRLNADGFVDTSFNPGTGANGGLYAIALQADGKVLIGGVFTSYNGTPRNRFTRLNADGSVDTSFLNTSTGADNDSVNTIAIQADGKVLIGGFFTSYNGVGRNRLARLNADGSLDTSFLNTGTGANSGVLTIAHQPDGKVLIGGEFTSYNGTARNRVARLNADGSVDTSFLNSGMGANDSVNIIALQPDGKVLIGGFFTSYNGVGRNRIARLNLDGSLDTTFLNTATAADNDSVNTIALQPDGKILIGGVFTSYNGVGRNRVARLNADGSVDTSFLNTGTGANNTVFAIAVQPDGKILIGGFFTSYNGTTRNSIARLNADGSLDTSFLNTGTGANSGVLTIAHQPDGKVLIGGGFMTYNGVGRNRVARLNADGSVDTSFNPGTGANSGVLTIALQPDSKVLIGGVFTSVDTYTRDRIARLENTPKVASGVMLTSNPNPSQFGQSVTFTATTTPITATGTISFTFGGSTSTTVTSTLVSGVATYVTSTLPVGQTGVTAAYSGDAGLSPSTSPLYTQTVSKAATSITVTSAPNPSVSGQTATFTATVNPAAATGTVTFTIGITDVTASLSGGIATYVTNTLPIGSYPVTAVYGTSAVYSGSVSSGQYTHTVVTACNPLVVTSSTDNGTGATCGTFSYAILSATSGMTITFSVTNVTFSGVLTPTLQSGVGIDGGANGVTLDGGTLPGDGLVLGGNNKLSKLTIRGFNGRGLVGLGLAPKTNNKLDRVRVIKT